MSLWGCRAVHGYARGRLIHSSLGSSSRRCVSSRAITTAHHTPKLHFKNAAPPHTTNAFNIQSPYTPSSAGVLGAQRRGIFLRNGATPNPECHKFFAEGLTFTEGETTIELKSVEDAATSPLAKRLFGVAGVKSVYIAPTYVTVTRTGESAREWKELIHDVSAELLDWHNSGEPVLLGPVPVAEDTEAKDEDDDVVLSIKELLAKKIRPMVQRDGGNILYVTWDPRDGVVYLQLQGACSSCPSSSNTLKGLVRRYLMHWIPEVTDVVEIPAGDVEEMKLEVEQWKSENPDYLNAPPVQSAAPSTTTQQT